MTKSEYSEFIANRDRDYINSSQHDPNSNPYKPSEMIQELCKGNVMPCLFGGKTKKAYAPIKSNGATASAVHHKIGTKFFH